MVPGANCAFRVAGGTIVTVFAAGPAAVGDDAFFADGARRVYAVGFVFAGAVFADILATLTAAEHAGGASHVYTPVFVAGDPAVLVATVVMHAALRAIIAPVAVFACLAGDVCAIAGDFAVVGVAVFVLRDAMLAVVEQIDANRPAVRAVPTIFTAISTAGCDFARRLIAG